MTTKNVPDEQRVVFPFGWMLLFVASLTVAGWIGLPMFLHWFPTATFRFGTETEQPISELFIRLLTLIHVSAGAAMFLGILVWRRYELRRTPATT